MEDVLFNDPATLRVIKVLWINFFDQNGGSCIMMPFCCKTKFVYVNESYTKLLYYVMYRRALYSRFDNYMDIRKTLNVIDSKLSMMSEVSGSLIGLNGSNLCKILNMLSCFSFKYYSKQ